MGSVNQQSGRFVNGNQGRIIVQYFQVLALTVGMHDRIIEPQTLKQRENKMKKLGWLLMMGWLSSVSANDVVTTKSIGLGLANDLAMASVEACREEGYQVSAVVVDRHGLLRSAMRDDLAAQYTLQIAQEKANMTIMSGLKSGQFRAMREDIRQELNHIDGLIVMVGALPIIAGGTTIGAIGVSGAPGGEKDELCAQKAIDAYQDRLDFAL